MATIKKLTQQVINAIAAGEIAERPASIVKELLENALDAQATDITIDLTHYGLEKIQVTDNGHGMDEQDIELALQPHTTSKILYLEDLDQLTTFGFRGEALASIASVAKVTLISRPLTKSLAHGWALTTDNGKVIDKKPVGCPPGTTVSVENLFATIPARLKFLKKPSTELRQIVEVVTASTLSHPRVNFLLMHDQKILLHLPAVSTFEQRLEQLLGSSLHFFLPVKHDHDQVSITGFTSQPQYTRKNTSQHFIFVNHRPVSHTGIGHAVKRMYGSLLDPRSQPVFYLYLQLPPAAVDSNVHPRKETVAFRDEQHILELVETAITQALHPDTLSFDYAIEKKSPSHMKALPSLSTLLKKQVSTWQLATNDETPEIIQFDQTYLIYPTDDHLVLIDQHAAHERILFEQFLRVYEEKESHHESIELKPALTFSLTPRDAHILLENISVLNDLGFELEPFGNASFKCTAVPVLFQDRNIMTLIMELVDDVAESIPVTDLDSATHRTLAYLACRRAIKAGDPLTPAQRQELIVKLADTTSHFTCPHGRPVSMTMSTGELETLFKRK